ncbi:tetratricopeptide repeat protein 5-like [Halichondria panicea]|uniref:tetratricopeptide repeat protein 5-like n=1 Tax=Halichondria panicea TaxID=6063 RepID=UPI00312B8B53
MESEENFQLQQESSAQQEADLKRAQDAVTELYVFHRQYLETHPLEQAGRKTVDVEEKLKETLSLLDSVQDSLPKVQWWCLRGRALNILPDHSQEAQDSLSKAIKHDPTLIQAWNDLGETYWKAGNVIQAHDCFVGSLSHAKSKESLRNLSMVLRQLGKDAGEREAKIKESVEKAKEAVGMDVSDGTSWMVLGNAYLSLFFVSNQDPQILKQCTSAYSQAEKDSFVSNNPDLHFNKATLYQYEENYPAMLEQLSLSCTLDPNWATPREKRESMLKFLTTNARLIESKGKAKAKLLASLSSSLAQTRKYVGSEVGRVLVDTSGLQKGVNNGRVFLGGLVCVVPFKERVSYACVLVDTSGSAVGLTLYNLAQTTHLSVGDIIAIPDPLLRFTQVQDKSDTIQFHNIRVDNPSQLLINGQRLTKDKLAQSTVSITAFS